MIVKILNIMVCFTYHGVLLLGQSHIHSKSKKDKHVLHSKFMDISTANVQLTQTGTLTGKTMVGKLTKKY